MATPRKPHIKKRNPSESAAIKFLRSTIEPGMFGTVIAIDPVSSVCTGRAYTLDDMTAVEQFIEHQAAAHRNLYWSPNPTRTPLNKKPKSADIASMRWVHLDLDDPSPAALARVREYNPPPSMIVASGGGFNVYWALAKPIHANGNITELEDANRRVILDLGGDVGTQDIGRILRLPGTINYPSKTKLANGRVPVPATLVEINPERTYSLDDFPKLTAQELRDWGKKKEQPAPHANDRSRDLMAKIAKAVREGMTDAEIHAALDAHPHAADQADPARAVQRCIDKARSEQTSVIAEIKAHNALIFVNGKFLAMWPHIFDDGLPRLSHISDLKNYWKKIQRGKTSPVDLWLGSQSRTEYSGFTFKPGADGTGDKFNLFRGWGVEPDAKGDCSLFLAHLRDVICDGNADLNDYTIQWLANCVQEPENKPGTAIALSSKQGAGKGTVAEYIAPIFGTHLSRLNGPDQLLGRFNDTLAGKLIAFGDEAAWPNDRRGMEKLKSYITEPRITVERKHIPAIEIDNFCRFIFATNSQHSALAEIDDRRFVVLNASNARVNDHEYFKALAAERLSGGPAAFLHHLLNVKITRNLRVTPKTKALAEQKLLSLDDVGQFARQLLFRKRHERRNADMTVMVLEFGEIILPLRLHAFYLDWARHNSVRFTKTLDALCLGLRRYFTMTTREARADEIKTYQLPKRARVTTLPPLADGRKQFADALGQDVEWPSIQGTDP
jgi:hypothetical protein